MVGQQVNENSEMVAFVPPIGQATSCDRFCENIFRNSTAK